MENIAKSFIGVDVSMATLDIFIYPENKYFRIKNTVAGINKVISEIAHLNIGQVVCESSGGYEHHLISEFRKEGHKVWIVDPKRIKAFIASEGIKAKTDKIDAKMIALFASQKSCAYNAQAYSEDQKKLKALTNRRADLVEVMAEEKRRLKQEWDVTCQKIIIAHIEYLEKTIQTIEEKMGALVEKNDDLKKKSEIIESVIGVGKVTSRTLIATMPELGSLNNRQVAALLGVAPYTKQSGKFNGSAVIRGGRFIPRKALYMAALTASRSNPDLKTFYNRLIQNGKPAKVALVAVMRKLIVYLNVLLRKNENWNPEFGKKS